MLDKIKKVQTSGKRINPRDGKTFLFKSGENYYIGRNNNRTLIYMKIGEDGTFTNAEDM